jgi:hypothetical protein
MKRIGKWEKRNDQYEFGIILLAFSEQIEDEKNHQELVDHYKEEFEKILLDSFKQKKASIAFRVK